MGLHTYKICTSLKFLFPFRYLLVTFCIIKYRRGGKQMPPCLAYMINITNPLMFNRTGKFEALSSKWSHSVQTTEVTNLLSKQREISICNTRMSNILLPQDNTCYFSHHLPSPVMRKELGGVTVSRNAVFTGFIFHANVLSCIRTGSQ